jgi:hypothetical protein
LASRLSEPAMAESFQKVVYHGPAGEVSLVSGRDLPADVRYDELFKDRHSQRRCSVGDEDAPH